MGYLKATEPLDYEGTRRASERARSLATMELLVTYWSNATREDPIRMFGDELEFMVLQLDKVHSKVKLVPCCPHVIKYFDEHFSKESPGFQVIPEFASYMVETVPDKPISLDTDFAADILNGLKHRRSVLGDVLRKLGIPNAHPFTLSSFPLLGCKDTVYMGDDAFRKILLAETGGLQTLYAPDILVNPHPRFLRLAINIRSRRRKRVIIFARRQVPLTLKTREAVAKTIPTPILRESIERLRRSLCTLAVLLNNIGKTPDVNTCTLSLYQEVIKKVPPLKECSFDTNLMKRMPKVQLKKGLCQARLIERLQGTIKQIETCMTECSRYRLDLMSQLPALEKDYGRAVEYFRCIYTMFTNVCCNIIVERKPPCTDDDPCKRCNGNIVKPAADVDADADSDQIVKSGKTIVVMGEHGRVQLALDSIPEGKWFNPLEDSRLEMYINQCISNSNVAELKAPNASQDFDSEGTDVGGEPWEREKSAFSDAGVIYMDSMVFGMGMCCIQTTFSCRNEPEARYLYDQLLVLSPLFLALTASTVSFRGQIADTDTRWDVLSQSVDDRKDHERVLYRKSRFSSSSLYISRDALHLQNYPWLNDVVVAANTAVYNQCKSIDPIIARHFAYILSRDPVICYGDVQGFDKCTDGHFEIFQSANWNTVRFKPPPLVDGAYPVPWRVEFRCCEAQLTDFENAAVIALVAIMVKTIIRQKWKLYMPISLVDANIAVSCEVEACKNGSFYFPTTPLQEAVKVRKRKLEDILLHPETGLLTKCMQELNNDLTHGLITKETHDLYCQYLDLFKQRCLGTQTTNATQLRGMYKQFQNNGLITHEMAYKVISSIHTQAT